MDVTGVGLRVPTDRFISDMEGHGQDFGYYSECDEKLRKGLGKGIGQSNLFFQITLAPM